MVGNIVLFMVGAGIGGGLVAYHEHRVKAAVQTERRESNRLRQALSEQMIRNAQNKAYSEGFDAGVSCPISEAERLARTFAARKGTAQIRTQREA